jgi:hypothetical protein
VSVDPREIDLDTESASLIDHIRGSLTIQAEMLVRILDTMPKELHLLAELLEDVGNRYIDLSELVTEASEGKLNSNVCPSR